MSNDKASEAREGLLDNIAGKAKEVAGAVSGKDDLVEEGQLQQAEARNRKEALADEAIADAKREEAAQDVRQTSEEAAEQQKAAKAAAEREEAAAERQRATEHAEAARTAEQQKAEGQKVAEHQADELAESRLNDAEALEADADLHRTDRRRRQAAPRARGSHRRPAGRAAARPDPELRTTMIRTLIALPYEIARLPLVMIDNRLASEGGGRRHVPTGARPRPRLGRQGRRCRAARPLHRPARGRATRAVRDLAKAAQLEQEAAERREQASKEAAAGRREATKKRKAAQERAAKGLEEAEAAEARGKREAKAKATKAANARKAAADKKAASATATAEQRKSNVDSAAAAKRKTAQRKAKAELDDARETKKSADESRADAERLSELADAKKQDRKQD